MGHAHFSFQVPAGNQISPTREERLRKPLTYEQAMAIKDSARRWKPSPWKLLVWRGPSVTAKYKGQEMVDTNFTGATPEDFQNINAELKDGRLYTDVDDLHRRDVAVIGADVAQRLFEGQDPIGKAIQVDGHSFEVDRDVGKAQGLSAVTTATIGSFTSPTSLIARLYPKAKENFIAAMALPGKMDQAKDEITGVLRRLRSDKPNDPDSFGIATAEIHHHAIPRHHGMVVLVTVVISSIGLLVGGIGVMNIMLVSVTERTREIGVRKAIGARRSDITWQFLLEAMTLTGHRRRAGNPPVREPQLS